MKNNKQIRIAFIGCGGVAQTYLAIYKKLNFVRVVACVDTNLESANRAAEFLQEGEPILTTTDFTQAFSTDADTFIINTPNHLHHEQAITALNADKNILLQKPVASTLQESIEIAEIAGKSKSVSALYMSYFDQPLFYDLREMIQVGWFGKVSHFYARLMHRGGLRLSNEAQKGNKTWRGSLKQTGGGCFIQLAVHYIHLFEWLADAKITKVQGLTKNQHCDGIEGEDFAAAMFEFENGVTATIETAWNVAGEQFSVHGTGGSCEYLNNRFLLAQSEKGNFRGRVVNYQSLPNSGINLVTSSGVERFQEIIPPALDDISNKLNQHRLFLENLRDGVNPFVSVISGVNDMRVVAAVYQAANTKSVVEVGGKMSSEIVNNGNCLPNIDAEKSIVKVSF